MPQKSKSIEPPGRQKYRDQNFQTLGALGVLGS
jgi:hypothetical protein